MELSSQEKITIIMNEYNTLRSEIIQKNSNTVQIVALNTIACFTIIGVAAAMLASNNMPVSVFGYLVGILITLSLGIAIWAIKWLKYDTKRISQRLRDIEKDVNDRAGEDLLCWERQFGWGDAFRNARGS